MPPPHEPNNGTMAKIPWGILLTIISWIVLGVMSFSMMETKEHAEKTYIRKDVFEQYAKSNETQLGEIKQLLKSIDEKLDNKQDKGTKP